MLAPACSSRRSWTLGNSAFRLVRNASTPTTLSAIDSVFELSTNNPFYQVTSSLFDLVHTTTGFPWWLSITMTTMCIRTALHLPAAVAAQRNQARLKLLEPEFREEERKLLAHLRHANWLYKWTPEEARLSQRLSLRKLKVDMFEKHGVHPLKSLVVTASQVPVWVIVSLSLRSMCGYYGGDPFEGFLEEGGPWFRSLLARDSTFILPSVLGFLTLANIKLGDLVQPSSSLDPKVIRVQRKMKMVSYSLGLSMVAFSAVMPSCISLYWAASAVYSTCQYLLLATPAVRRLFGIPQIANEPDVKRIFWR